MFTAGHAGHKNNHYNIMGQQLDNKRKCHVRSVMILCKVYNYYCAQTYFTPVTTDDDCRVISCLCNL